MEGSAILSLLTELELEDLLTGSERPDGLKPDDLAALYIAIAIGSQVRASCARDKRCATKYASRGRQIAFDGMLMDPSLSMVRNFLLMAFYMLGACRRNTAFVYLGVATRAAIAIGLHADPNKSICYQVIDYSSRRRTWKSLCTLNIVVCSLFGRPSGLPPIETGHNEDGDSPALNSTSDPSAHAIFEVSLILEQISQKICRQERMNISTAEAFLQQLRQWSRSLPSELRHFSRREGSCAVFADRRVLIGNMHVSCFYYFAVISITRPFFIQHLISHLRSNRNTGIEKPQETKVAALAQACISSAIYVVELCAKASESNLLLANMCLLQAFVFGAGLILGFSSFTGEVTPDPRDAFHKARTVLERLGTANPQARHYRDILTDFSHAIDKYRERITCKEGREIYAYVDRILTIDNKNATERPVPGDSSDSQPGYPDIATSDYFSAEQSELSPRLSNALDLEIHWDEISEQQFTSLNIDGLLSDVVLDTML
ncbi:hypothetical protein TARUN_5907 [Trichoderma arundinaceum]|uniref:Xylanolytic transcriptional activator regulatory domain-containing protein n=1 Tax=Trichoderma arundinaceum TaxID=490622 RepID=A0A395NJX4_TRIAR|nr:hypothetical protein TARUN_5907 [Trichoderma arundinaceum]